MGGKHNYFRPVLAQQRRAMFEKPRPRLTWAESRKMVSTSNDLDQFAEALAQRAGPEANMILAQRVLARNIKRRRS
jgi:hypothetical protein